MCRGFEPRDGAKESGKARKYILNSCSHYSLFPGEILLRSSCLPFGPKTWKPFSSHQKTDCFNADPFSLTLPSTNTMTAWKDEEKRGWQMSERREGGREGGRRRVRYPLQTLVSSRPLALPHWTLFTGGLNRILLLYLKRHPVPLMRDGTSEWSLSEKRSSKRRYDLTAKR